MAKATKKTNKDENKPLQKKELPLKADMSFEELLHHAANPTPKIPSGLKVINPLSTGEFCVTFDPKTKVWEELKGHDVKGNEYWEVIPPKKP
jgi:hypothetical protein